MWDECNCVIVWTFFEITLLWDWNVNWLFPLLRPLLSFPNLWHHNYTYELQMPQIYSPCKWKFVHFDQHFLFPQPFSMLTTIHFILLTNSFFFFLRFYSYMKSYFVWHFTSHNTLKVHPLLLWMSEFPSFSGLNHSPLHVCYPCICWWTQVDSISWLLCIMLQ